MPKVKLFEYRMTIAKKLKHAREEAGLRQDQAAKRLKKSQSYISKVESGRKDLRISQLKILSGLYNKRISEFLE